MIDALRVSELARYLKELVESDLRLSNIWVEGEVSNFSRSGAGHLYFTLKDASAQLRAVMFGRSYRGVPASASSGQGLENGAQVLAHGNVAVYEARGELQLIVDYVKPAGVGVWQAQFERLQEQLEAEGLFEPSRKRPLPPFPRRVGVVTSPTGAVIHDILHVAERRWPLVEIVLAPTAVQGPDAAPGIVDALRALNAQPDIDVIILARGGGSIEELWPFNDESVARAVYGSRVPVVCGVGHETDYTIADLVADLRAPTPSAAAETVLPDRAEIARRLDGFAFSLQAWTNGALNQALSATRHARQRLQAARPAPERLRDRVLALARRAEAAVERASASRGERLAGFLARLSSLDPRATLARGYAVVQMREDRRAVTSIKQVGRRERLTIHVQDGKFPAEVSKQYGF